MKLLVVLSIKEHQEQVANLLHNAGIKRFSVIDITGYKKNQEDFGWFAINAKSAKTNSIALFSFVDEPAARKGIEAVSSCNIATNNPFPVHAFMMRVDEFSKFL